MPQYVIAAAIGVGLLLIVVGGWVVWRRNRGPELARALEAVAIERVQNVLLPDGMGGHIQVEHLLLTGHGFLVIDAKPFAGIIFASERMADWTVIGKQGRFTFPNPLGTLYDRVAALKQLVREVPVAGYVLFNGSADFSKGRPRDVLSAAELVERYRRPDPAELERLLVAFAPHWDRVKQAVEPVP
ncbi:MAG TPA: nuclease-related domain-containing protein [Gammaproteobacteria bacterium]|nr:nuclease-related domain-containing protein [Gammaproteobacteria bacterium]